MLLKSLFHLLEFCLFYIINRKSIIPKICNDSSSFLKRNSSPTFGFKYRTYDSDSWTWPNIYDVWLCSFTGIYFCFIRLLISDYLFSSLDFAQNCLDFLVLHQGKRKRRPFGSPFSFVCFIDVFDTKPSSLLIIFLILRFQKVMV